MLTRIDLLTCDHVEEDEPLEQDETASRNFHLNINRIAKAAQYSM